MLGGVGDLVVPVFRSSRDAEANCQVCRSPGGHRGDFYRLASGAAQRPSQIGFTSRIKKLPGEVFTYFADPSNQLGFVETVPLLVVSRSRPSWTAEHRLGVYATVVSGVSGVFQDRPDGGSMAPARWRLSGSAFLLCCVKPVVRSPRPFWRGQRIALVALDGPQILSSFGFKRPKKMLEYRDLSFAVDIRLPEFLQQRTVENRDHGVRNGVCVECRG
jgi:hypothetical protein